MTTTMPAHQIITDVLLNSRFGAVADDFIIQAVLNAAHATAAKTPATLVMDEGPISKEDWIGAATEIRDHLTALVRANAGLESSYYVAPRWYAIVSRSQGRILCQEFPTDEARQEWFDHQGDQDGDYYYHADISRTGEIRSMDLASTGNAVGA